MRAILNTLFDHQALSQEQAREVLLNIAAQQYNPAQVTAFLSAYLMRSITVEELRGFREAMLELCTPLELEAGNAVDIVGTGGDGKDTFNISTLSCLVVAACGQKVVKHGNYGVSSISGSSNVLEALGYRFSNVQDVLKKQLDESNICFLHAPLFHPAMKSVAIMRKELAVRTFFNMLGPLVNPAHPKYQLIGVSDLVTARLYNYLLQEGTHQYRIVHSLDGYDEISLTGEFKVLGPDSEKILEPADLGLKAILASDLAGGSTVDEAARLFRRIIDGNGNDAQNATVAANAGMAMHCVSPEKGLSDCISEAGEALLSGKAARILKHITEN